jgi:hypothetical protein
MAFGDIELPGGGIIERPDMHIVPNPCGAEVDRNWDAVRRIFNQIITNIYNSQAGGSLIAEVQLAADPVECVKPLVDVVEGTFRPLFVEDPENPMIRPTVVHNYRSLGVVQQQVGVNPKGYIVFDPNDASLQKWELWQLDHVPVTILSDAEFISGQGIHFTGMVATVIPCGPAEDDVGVDIETVTARAIYNLGLNGVGGCSLYSNEVELEVFSSTNDPTEYVEITFDTVQVLTDVYQSSAYGNIIGYYYRLYVPCVELVGEDILIYVDRCAAQSGSGG